MLAVGTHVELTGPYTVRKTVAVVSEDGRSVVLMDDPDCVQGERTPYVTEDGTSWWLADADGTPWKVDAPVTMTVVAEGNADWMDDYVPCERCGQAVLEYPCEACGHEGD